MATRDFLVLKGTVHGKTIELEDETGLPDGWRVIVGIRLLPGDGLRLSAGAWADMTPEQVKDLEETLSMLRGRPVKISDVDPT
jgi:hypothetical protein